MNIGAAAKLTGLPRKTIRYYEEIGLVLAARGDNNYRCYTDAEVQKLRFLARARGLGFEIQDCRMLLKLYDDKLRASADVRSIAIEHLRQIDDKLEQLSGIRETISGLVMACSGDDQSDCPILIEFEK